MLFRAAVNIYSGNHTKQITALSG